MNSISKKALLSMLVFAAMQVNTVQAFAFLGYFDSFLGKLPAQSPVSTAVEPQVTVPQEATDTEVTFDTVPGLNGVAVISPSFMPLDKAKNAGIKFDKAAALKVASLNEQAVQGVADRLTTAGEMNSLPTVANVNVVSVENAGIAFDKAAALKLQNLNEAAVLRASEQLVAPGTVNSLAQQSRFGRFKAACGNTVTAVREKASNMIAPVRERADKVVASARATRPVQFVESTVTKYPRASKVVAGAAVVGAVYAAANSERGQKVRAKIANSQAYKAVANFVQENKETLLQVAAGVALFASVAAAGQAYVSPEVAEQLAEAAC